MITKDNIIRVCAMAFIAAPSLLTACSSEEDNAILQEELCRIVVEVNEQPMTDALAPSREVETRASATTTSTLNSFKMNGVYKDDYLNKYTKKEYTVTRQNSGWTIEPGTWPKDTNGDAVSSPEFYAHTGGTFYLNNDGSSYIRHIISEDASNQHDLLVAKNSATYNSNEGVGKVSLTFDHACAAVTFNVQITQTLAGKLVNEQLTINSIKLHNVFNDGKYDYNTGWSNVTYATSNDQQVKTCYTLNSGVLSVGIDPQDLSCDDIFVIPQSREANGTEGVYLDIAYTIGETSATAILPFSVNWEAGYKYTINIRLGTKQILIP